MNYIIFILITGVVFYFIWYKSQLRGKNDLEKWVITYFKYYTVFPGYNFTRNVNKKFDAEYDELVKKQISVESIKTKALGKLGLDESELTEIEPIHFEDYYYDLDDIDENSSRSPDANIMIGVGKDGKFRTSAYQVTWLFATAKQICIYQEIFYLHKNESDEITRQFLWKHITSITSLRNTLKITQKNGQQKSQKVDVFQVVVPGDVFTCSMEPTGYTQRAIQAMRQRLVD
jgi:hypothetical protein